MASSDWVVARPSFTLVLLYGPWFHWFIYCGDSTIHGELLAFINILCLPNVFVVNK